MVAALQAMVGLYYQRVWVSSEFRTIKYLRKLYGKKDGIFFFGDSVLRYTAPQDSDTSSIPEMLQQELSDPVHSLDGGAFQMDMYASLMQTLAARGTRPKAVLVPINLRSFSISWDCYPAWQFEKPKLLLHSERSFLVRTFAKPLLVFKAIHLTPISSKEYWETPVLIAGKDVGSMKFVHDTYLVSPDPAEKRAWFLKLYYLYKLDARHRKAAALQKLADLLRREKIPAHFYVVPLDMETGQAALKDEFTNQVRENIGVLRKVLAEQGHELHDFSALLPSSCFSYPANVPDEHLNQEGRRRMAAALAPLLKGGTVDGP